MNVVGYGGGTDSTAMLIGLWKNHIPVDLILFADPGGEQPHTYAYLEIMDRWLKEHDMPPITRVWYQEKSGQRLTLEQECLRSGTLPSIAYGRKSCSLKHKVAPQERFCNQYQPCLDTWTRGEKVVKFIGYTQILLLIGVAGLMFLIIGGLAFISHYYTLNGIKSKTVGDGQHGTARWATKQEIRQTYAHIPFEPELWRQGKNLPDQQGLILGCEGPKGHVTAVVDTDDIHALVTAASGAGKTAFFLYPNIEYALATGMSFLCTDTKGDLFRNYAGIARECYGYQTAILDLRNPTRSDGNNLLHLINKYMDIYKAEPDNLAAKAKAEKYGAKRIL